MLSGGSRSLIPGRGGLGRSVGSAPLGTTNPCLVDQPTQSGTDHFF